MPYAFLRSEHSESLCCCYRVLKPGSPLKPALFVTLQEGSLINDSIKHQERDETAGCLSIGDVGWLWLYLEQVNAMNAHFYEQPAS